MMFAAALAKCFKKILCYGQGCVSPSILSTISVSISEKDRINQQYGQVEQSKQKCFLTLLLSERPNLYGVLAILSAIGLKLQLSLFKKGNNFHDLQDQVLLQGDLFLKERICSKRNKFFPLRVDPC